VIGATRIKAFLLAALMIGCARKPDELHVTPFAAGEWTVAGHTQRGAIVQRSRDMQPRAARAEPQPRQPTFAGAGERPTPLAADAFTIIEGPGPIHLVRIDNGRFYASATGQPQLLPSPTDSLRYAFEHEHAIWVFKPPHELRKFTLDYDRDTLITKQREGVVILYWSARPMWSADGKFISFLSNREAVRAATSGQSLWVIDAYSGVQSALLDSLRQSVSTEGVFGDEFVFISDAQPGVFAVHPRTRAVRKLGDGYVLASHARGRALLLNENGRLRLLRGGETFTLPDPPAGFVWSTQASVSPGGDHVAVLSTDQAGVYMLHVMDGTSSIAPYRLPAPPSHGPAWISDDALIFTVQERTGLQTYRAVLR
jgi:hypothetical protein